MPIAANQLEAKPAKQEALGSDPSLVAGEGIFYTKSVSGVVEAFFKNGSGQVIQLTSNGQLIGGDIVNSFEKSFTSGHSGIIAAKTPVALKDDGSIVPGDSDDVDAAQIIGFTKTSIAIGANGVVILFGRNMPGALTGLGFTPGAEIFIDETAGSLTDDVSGFTGADDAIIRLGVAAMPDNTTGAAATDLIMMREVIGSP